MEDLTDSLRREFGDVEKLFKHFANPEGKITGKEALQYFPNVFGVSKEDLSYVWKECTKNGTLELNEFIHALQIIQKRLDFYREKVLALPPEKIQQYDVHFANIGKTNDGVAFVPTEKAKQFFAMSKLPFEKLNKVWFIVFDQEFPDGIKKKKFYIGLNMIYLALGDSSFAIPDSKILGQFKSPFGEDKETFDISPQSPKKENTLGIMDNFMQQPQPQTSQQNIQPINPMNNITNMSISMNKEIKNIDLVEQQQVKYQGYMSSEINRIVEESQRIRKRFAEMDNQRKGFQEKIKNARNQERELQIALNEEKRNFESIKRQNYLEQRSLMQINYEIKKIEKEKEEYSNGITQIKEEIEKINEIKEVKLSEKQELYKRNEETKKDLEYEINIVVNLNHELLELKTNGTTEVDEEYNELNTQIIEKRKVANTLRTSIEDLENEINERKLEREKLNMEIQRLDQIEIEHNDRIADFILQKSRMGEDFDEMKKRYNYLSTKINTRKGQLALKTLQSYLEKSKEYLNLFDTNLEKMEGQIPEPNSIQITTLDTSVVYEQPAVKKLPAPVLTKNVFHQEEQKKDDFGFEDDDDFFSSTRGSMTANEVKPKIEEKKVEIKKEAPKQQDDDFGFEDDFFSSTPSTNNTSTKEKEEKTKIESKEEKKQQEIDDFGFEDETTDDFFSSSSTDKKEEKKPKIENKPKQEEISDDGFGDDFGFGDEEPTESVNKEPKKEKEENKTIDEKKPKNDDFGFEDDEFFTDDSKKEEVKEEAKESKKENEEQPKAAEQTEKEVEKKDDGFGDDGFGDDGFGDDDFFAETKKEESKPVETEVKQEKETKKEEPADKKQDDGFGDDFGFGDDGDDFFGKKDSSEPPKDEKLHKIEITKPEEEKEEPPKEEKVQDKLENPFSDDFKDDVFGKKTDNPFADDVFNEDSSKRDSGNFRSIMDELNTPMTPTTSLKRNNVSFEKSPVMDDEFDNLQKQFEADDDFGF